MTTRPPAPNFLLLQFIRTMCRRSALSLPAAALLSIGPKAWADPTGGVVVSGEGTITTASPSQTVIHQGSQNLQIDWSSFNLGVNETVQFQQPSSSAVALNRILDQSPSQILGRIDANGKVILVNPNGLLFGKSAQLNVGSLVASSLDVVGFDAASGRYRFGSNRDPGAVTNEGTITAAAGGSVTLLGSRVTNTGRIVADFGAVNLASGRAATLDLAGDGLLQLEVDGRLASGDAAGVENSGFVQANGGRVLLSAQALDGVLGNLVNNTGVVRANRVENKGGTIRLVGSGTVRNSGTLNAAAGDAVSTGGRVEMLGEQVGLFGNARVDVSGATGGGVALIGGDYQGKNADVPNAARTYVGSGAVIDADAGSTGDGGKVIVWSDELTRLNGHISARGGAESGNGGFAEVSGKSSLVFTGTAELGTSHGDGGTLLLDPLNITIASGAATDSDVDDGTYAFSEDAADSVTIGADRIEQLLSGGLSVVLQATNTITQDADADIDVFGDSGASGQSLTLEAADITLGGDILLNGGAINVLASGGATVQGALATSSMVQVVATAGSVNMTDGSSISAGFGGMQLTAGQDARVTRLTTPGNVNVTAAGMILDDGNDTTTIAASTAALTAARIGGGVDGALDTDVGTLQFKASANEAQIVERDDVTVSWGQAAADLYVTTLDGSITAGTVYGDNLFLTANGAGSDITVNSGVFGGAATLLNAGRDIVVNGTVGAFNPYAGSQLTAGRDIVGGASHVVKGDYLGASAASIGVVGGIRLNTEVDGASLYASQGDIRITNLNSLIVDSVHAPNGVVDVSVTNGNLGVMQLTAGSAVLTANNGAIFDWNLFPLAVDVDSLTLTANSVGGSVSTFEVNANTLTVNTNVGARIAELDGLAFTNIHNGTGAVTLSSGGDVTVGDVSSNGAVTLTSGGAILDDGNDGTWIQGSSVALNAQTRLGTVTDFNATSNALFGNSLDVQTSGALALVVNDDAGQINLNLSGAPTVAAGAVRLGSAASGRAGSIVLHSPGDLDLSHFATGAIDIGPANTTSIGLHSDATLFLPSGSITNQPADLLFVRGSTDIANLDADPRTLTIDADHLIFRSGSAGGATTLNASVNRLDVELTKAIFYDRDLTVNETGDVMLGAVNAGHGSVTLSAAGAVTDDGDDSTLVSGDVVTLAGASLGAVGNALDTQANTLALAASAGGAYVSEADGVTLSANVAGPLDLRTLGDGQLVVNSTTAGGVNLATGGSIFSSISIRDVIDAGFNDVTLTAGPVGNRDLIFAGTANNRIIADELNLVLLGTGFSPLNTTVNSLAASEFTDAADLYIHETDGLALTATGTGRVSLTTDGGLLTVNTVQAGSGSLASGGSIDIAGQIEVTNSVALTVASTGSVTDGAGGVPIIADGLSLQGGTFGNAGNALDTRVSRLSATASAPGGGVFVAEQDGLTLTTISVGGDATVTTASGDITVNTVTAGDTVTLTAAGGAILDDNNNSTRITATNGIALSAANNIGTVTTFDPAATFYGSNLDVQTNGALSAAVTSSTGAMNLLITGAPTVASGRLSLGGASGGAGSMVLQSLGDLDLSGLAAGAIALGAGNTSRVALLTNNTLTLPSSTGFLAQPAGLLRMHSGLLADSNGGSIDLVLAAGALDFYGAGASAANLTLDAGKLDLQFNGPLTIHEAGDITLGTVVVGGPLAIHAGGAITDDGDDGTYLFGASLGLYGESVGASGNAIDVDTSTVNLAASTGSIFADIRSSSMLTANAAGSVNLRTRNTDMLVTGSITGGNGVSLTADGANHSIRVQGDVDSGAGTVTLTAGTPSARGSVLASGFTFSGAALDVTAADIGASFQSLRTNVGSLKASATGGVYIDDADGLTIDSVNAPTVRLTAGGAIADSTSGTPSIVAGSLTVQGTSIGTISNALDTQVNTLVANASAGDAWIVEADGLTATGTAAGVMDLRTTLGGITAGFGGGVLAGFGGLTLATGNDGGDIVINGRVSAGTSTARLIAGDGAIIGTGPGIVYGHEIVASGSQIGSNSFGLSTEADALILSSPGDIHVWDQSDVTLNANAGGSVEALSFGALTIDAVTASTVLLYGGTQITDGVGDAPSIVTQDLILNGGVIGTASNALNVQADTLLVLGGELNLAERDALRIDYIETTADANVSAGGNLVVGSVLTGGTAAFNSGNSIADDGDDSTFIDAGGVALTASNNIGTVTNIDAATGAEIGDAIAVRTSGTLQARSDSNVGQINLQIVDVAPVVAAGGISVGSGPGAAGLVALHAPGDLNLSGLAAGAISASGTNSTTVALHAGNVLTLPSNGAFASPSLGRLLIRGADVVDDDATPHTLSLQASHLDFRSGGSAATTLDTNVDQLDAVIGSGLNLTVNEEDSLALGAISAVGGSVNITANGVIADDGIGSTRLVADSATLSGASIGSTNAGIGTQVATLSANALDVVNIDEVDALTLTRASGRSVSVQTLDGPLTVGEVSGLSDVTLTAGGAGNAVTLDGIVSSPGSMTITAGTATNGGAIQTTANGGVEGGLLTLTGSAIGSDSARLNTTVDALSASAGSGGIHIDESDALDVTEARSAGGPIDIRTANGALRVAGDVFGDRVNLSAGGDGSGIAVEGQVSATDEVLLTAGTPGVRGTITATANGQIRGESLSATASAIGTNAQGLNTQVRSLDVTATNGGIFVTEADDVSVNVTAAGDVMLAAGGAISTAAGARVTGNTFTASGSSIGSSSQRLSTSVATLDATSTSGGIFVTEGDALNLSASAGGGTVDVRTINGALTLGSVSGENVMLLAGGAGNAIVGGAGNQVTGSTVTASGSSIGSSTSRLNTAAGTLNVTSTSGDIFVAEADVLDLTANASGGAVDVQTTNGSLTVASVTGEGVTLIAGGAGSNLTLNGIVDAGTNDAILTAGTASSGGAISGGAGHQVVGNALVASGSRIGTSNGPLQLNVNSLSATAGNGGVYVTDPNGLILKNLIASGAIDVRSPGGDVIIGSVQGAGDVLVAGRSIVDDGNDATALTGDFVALESGSIGTATRRLDIDARMLNALAGVGDIFIEARNGLDSVNMEAPGGRIELISLAGDIHLGSVIAGGTVLLSAGGNLHAIDGSAGIVARDAELRAGTADPTKGRIGSLLRPIDVRLDEGEVLALFVPEAANPYDPGRAPAISPSNGVTLTLSRFAPSSQTAIRAAFGALDGLSAAPFVSPRARVSSLTGTVQPLIGPGWRPLDPEVKLLSTSDPPVCLPPDQQGEKRFAGGC